MQPDKKLNRSRNRAIEPNQPLKCNIMKEIKLKIYTFDELSEEAQHAVCEREREKTDNFGTYAQEDDAIERHETLKGFCRALGLWFDVDYDHCHRFISWGFKDCSIDGKEITGKYLWRFLDKVYFNIRSRKFYGKFVPCEKDAEHPIGQRLVSRRSRIQWIEQNCPFTGMCFDCDILDEIFKWYKKPDWNMSLHDLLDDCFSTFLSRWAEDDEYHMTDEYIGDMIANNREDQEYLEDGTEFDGNYEEFVEEVEIKTDAA